jgi:hypothetical protein
VTDERAADLACKKFLGWKPLNYVPRPRVLEDDGEAMRLLSALRLAGYTTCIYPQLVTIHNRLGEELGDKLAEAAIVGADLRTAIVRAAAQIRWR